MSYSSVLKIKPFRDLWLGQTISQLGDGFYFVAFMFMVKKITNSDQMVGIVGAAETLPFLLFSFYAGVVVDRIDRKKVLFWSDGLCGVLLAAFAGLVYYYNGKPPAWGLVVIPFILSSIRAFFHPARSAAIPNLVPADKLPVANALGSLTQSISPMISMALSGSVMGLIYDQSPKYFFVIVVGLNAISFLISTIYIIRLPEIIPDRENIQESHAKQDFVDGLRYIGGRKVLKAILALQAALSLSISPFFVTYIAANDAWFGGKPGSIAWFEFAFLVGLVASNIYVGKLNLKKPGQGFIWGLAVVGLCVIFMAFSKNFWMFVWWQVPCGLAIPFASLPMTHWMQVGIPDEFRGRFNSVFMMLQNGVMPIGAVLGGGLVAKFGLEMMFVLMGLGMMAATLSGLLIQEFRDLTIPESNEPVTEPVA